MRSRQEKKVEGEESNKLFDYLSDDEDEEPCNDVDKFADVDDNGLGLTPLVREHQNYMEALLRKLKGNEMGITDPFSIVEKSKEKYPIHDDQTHCDSRNSRGKILAISMVVEARFSEKEEMLSLKRKNVFVEEKDVFIEEKRSCRRKEKESVLTNVVKRLE
ncbi:hypothetical protein Tco_1214386 [Tanacetum coccineum]